MFYLSLSVQTVKINSQLIQTFPVCVCTTEVMSCQSVPYFVLTYYELFHKHIKGHI